MGTGPDEIEALRILLAGATDTRILSKNDETSLLRGFSCVVRSFDSAARHAQRFLSAKALSLQSPTRSSLEIDVSTSQRLLSVLPNPQKRSQWLLGVPVRARMLCSARDRARS